MGLAFERGPLQSPGRLRRVAPFALTASAVLGLTTTGKVTSSTLLILTIIGLGVIVTAALVIPWRNISIGLQAIVPISFYGVIGLLRVATGGTSSSAGVLCLLPICWVAMYHRRLELIISLFATLGVFILPVVLVGGSSYPPIDVQRGMSVTLIGLLVGASVQYMVTRLENMREHAQTTADRLNAVSILIRGISPDEDPRSSICKGVQQLVNACAVRLYEGSASSYRATVECGHADCIVEDNSEHTIAIKRVFRSHQVVTLSAERALWLSQGSEGTSCASCGNPTSKMVIYQPICDNNQILAVLMVALGKAIPATTSVLQTVAFVAGEFSAALHRSEILSEFRIRSRTDPLTGLANRQTILDVMDYELGQLAFADHLYVGLIDIDHFKDYNDSKGHLAGDELLVGAARSWQSCLRHGDALGRYGGDEFLMVLKDISAEEAVRITRRISSVTPMAQSVSIGLTECVPGEEVSSAVDRADRALYEVKRHGRNGVGVIRANPEQAVITYHFADLPEGSSA